MACPLADLGAFIGNLEDPFLIFVTGSTPASVEATLRNSIGNLSEDDRKALRIIFLSAAVGHRRTLSEVLTRPQLGTVNRYLQEHWAIRGVLNFTALNLGGNMIIAADSSSGTKLIECWRSKIGGRSLWHCNLDSPRCRLSKKAKQIAKEKVVRCNVVDAMRYGVALIQLLIMGTDAPAATVFNPAVYDSAGFFDRPGAPSSRFASGQTRETVPKSGPSMLDNLPRNMTDEQMADAAAARKAAAAAAEGARTDTRSAPGTFLALTGGQHTGTSSEGITPGEGATGTDLEGIRKKPRVQVHMEH